MKNMRKKSLAVVAGLVMTGLVGASAASLNGIKEQSLGSGTEVVASCDSDGVTVDYVATYKPLLETVTIDSVTIGDVAAACDGLPAEIVLTGDPVIPTDPPVVLATSVALTAAADPSFVPVFDTADIDAEAVTGIVITISG